MKQRPGRGGRRGGGARRGARELGQAHPEHPGERLGLLHPQEHPHPGLDLAHGAAPGDGHLRVFAGDPVGQRLLGPAALGAQDADPLAEIVVQRIPLIVRLFRHRTRIPSCDRCFRCCSESERRQGGATANPRLKTWCDLRHCSKVEQNRSRR